MLVYRTIEVDGVPVRLVDQGVGPPLLLVHGSPVSSWTFRHQVEALSDRYRVIAPDLVGFGKTPAPREGAGFALQAGILGGLLKSLALGPTRVVAHDWGGPVATAAALERPENVAALVLVNTTLAPDFRPPAYWRPLVTGRMGDLLVGRLNLVRWALPALLGAARKRAVRRRYAEALARPETRATVLALERLDGFAPLMKEVSSRLAALRHVPTLILWGEPDPYFRASDRARLVAALPGAELVMLKRAGHFPQEDAAEAFTAALARFLDAL